VCYFDGLNKYDGHRPVKIRHAKDECMQLISFNMYILNKGRIPTFPAPI
jgi:hypothetical protein